MTGGSWRVTTQLSLTGQNQLPNTTAPVALSLNPTATHSLPYGTGVGTASIVVSNAYLLAPGASVTLNLFDGSLTDMSGATAAFRLLRGYSIFVSDGGDTAGVSIGGAASNEHPLFSGGATYAKTVYPGGPDDSGGGGTIAGVAVTSSACNVLITNNSPTAFATVTASFAGTQCVSGVPIGLALALTYP